MKKALIVIDMQNDFIDGSLGTKEASQIVERVVNKIKSNKGRVYLMATRDTHENDYLSTQEGERLPVEHCIRQTAGWQIEKRVAAALGEDTPVIDKPTFGSVELAQKIASLPEIEEVELVGLCTDICVISNALLIKAFLPEVKVSVDAACCAGVTPQSHENALEAMRVCQIEIKTY